MICEICGNSYDVKGRYAKRTCSGACSHKLQNRTMGRSPNRKHGFTGEKLHNVWRSLLDRCNHHKDYAGRGIIVCEEWKEYVVFRMWAHENGYAEGLTIDRTDNDGNYEPENCRWVTMKVQCRNRRTSRVFEYNGEKRTVAEWAEISGINVHSLFARVNKLGWTFSKAINTKIQGT